MSIDACGACMSTIGGVCDKHSKNSINKTMDKKQQFIEKKLKEIMSNKFITALALELPAEVYDDCVKILRNKIQSALSECWDMAGEELIDKVDLEIEAWMGANQNLDREFTTNEMMKHLRNTALTSQKEGKRK